MAIRTVQSLVACPSTGGLTSSACILWVCGQRHIKVCGDNISKLSDSSPTNVN